MAKLRQLLASLVIAMMISGSIACWCPATAAGVATNGSGHARHQHGSPSAHEGCCHDDCTRGCMHVSAMVATATAVQPSRAALHLDDTALLPVRIDAFPPSPEQAVPIVASWNPALLPRETPVRRADRLLD